MEASIFLLFPFPYSFYLLKSLLTSFFFVPTTSEMPNSSSLVHLFLWNDPNVKAKQCSWDTGMLFFQLCFHTLPPFSKWLHVPLSLQIKLSLKISLQWIGGKELGTGSVRFQDEKKQVGEPSEMLQVILGKQISRVVWDFNSRSS